MHCGVCMPQLALVICRAPFVMLSSPTVEASFMWMQSTLIWEIADKSHYELLRSVRKEVSNSYFISNLLLIYY